jgi:hypothetical protein
MVPPTPDTTWYSDLYQGRSIALNGQRARRGNSIASKQCSARLIARPMYDRLARSSINSKCRSEIANDLE